MKSKEVITKVIRQEIGGLDYDPALLRRAVLAVKRTAREWMPKHDETAVTLHC